jgi:hypothetical protein
MGSNVYPVPSSGKTKYTQVITSSTTWTAPTVPTYEGIVTVTAVGGGGAGGNGSGGMSWTSTTNAQYGSPGGGGGGGGQVIIEQKVPLPAGTEVAVTVGAGGTPTPISTTPLNWNYFLNPKLKTAITGYAATANCTVARLTTPLPPYGWVGTTTASGGTLAVTPTSTTGVSFTYDTGNSAFTANSGSGGYRFAMATGGVPAGGQSFSAITITVTWYANATLIRSDVLTTTAGMTVNSTNYSQYNIAGSTANVIPTNATRFTINFSGNTTNTQPMYFTQFMLMPRELQTGNNQGGATNQYYIDPDWFTINPGASVVPVAFSGAADASTTTVVGGKSWGWNSPDGFGNTTVVGGNPGDGGSPGGDTSFGSYITAKGGGGGSGGGINYWTQPLGSGITGSTIFAIQQSGAVNQSANGGNGGGGGGFCVTNAGLNSLQGGGGGGAGGYPYFANTSLVTSNTLPVNGPVLNTKGGFGIQWSGGGGGFYGAPYSGGNNLVITGTGSSGGYSPTMGGVRLNGFGGGGIGGSAGSNIPHKAETGTGVYNSINASADVTGYASLSGLPQRGAIGTTNYASSGGAPATNATAGASGINYGDGGTGGNGGAGATATTLNGTTIANPGKGSIGGAGAQGIVIVEWWQ